MWVSGLQLPSRFWCNSVSFNLCEINSFLITEATLSNFDFPNYLSQRLFALNFYSVCKQPSNRKELRLSELDTISVKEKGMWIDFPLELLNLYSTRRPSWDIVITECAVIHCSFEYKTMNWEKFIGSLCKIFISTVTQWKCINNHKQWFILSHIYLFSSTEMAKFQDSDLWSYKFFIVFTSALVV